MGHFGGWTAEDTASVTQRLASKQRLDHLSTVPLSFDQLKSLIDRRLEIGWSQADLARQCESTPVTIHKFEAGYAIRPALFIDLCHYLGIEPQIEISVELSDLIESDLDR